MAIIGGKILRNNHYAANESMGGCVELYNLEDKTSELIKSMNHKTEKAAVMINCEWIDLRERNQNGCNNSKFKQ